MNKKWIIFFSFLKLFLTFGTKAIWKHTVLYSFDFSFVVEKKKKKGVENWGGDIFKIFRIFFEQRWLIYIISSHSI